MSGRFCVTPTGGISYRTLCASTVRSLYRHSCAIPFSLGFLALVPRSVLFYVAVWGSQRTWLRVARVWAKATLRILGIRVQLSGHLDSQPAVFVANHQSLLDIIIMPALLPPEIRFVARKNLRYVPFWGWIFVSGGAIPIERGPSGSSDVARLKKKLGRLPDKWSLMVFPEGTRSRAHSPKRFRKGAAICAAERNLPLIPLGVCDLGAVAPRGGGVLQGGDVFVSAGAPIYVKNNSDTALTMATTQAHDAVVKCIREANKLLARHHILDSS